VDFSPLERDGGELGECAKGVVILVDEVLGRYQGNKELGCFQQTQLLEVEVDLECPVLGRGVGVGGEGDGGRGHGNLGGRRGHQSAKNVKTGRNMIERCMLCSLVQEDCAGGLGSEGHQSREPRYAKKGLQSELKRGILRKQVASGQPANDTWA
jgi:hypothetical protein